MAFTVSTEPRENRQLAVIIEVSQDQVDKELRKAATKVAGQYRIPGFRKGKAPYHIVVQQFGLSNLYSEFVDDLGQQLFRDAIEQEKIEPYAQSSLEDIQLEPLVYKLIVPLEPEVKLGDYYAMRVEEDPIEVDEAEVERRLEMHRDEYAGWREVDRPSQYGDLLSADVRSVIVAEAGEEDAAETVVLDETDWDVTLDEENPLEPAGLDRELLDMRAGEEKDFVLSWPAEGQSVYAGRQAQFHVKVNSVQSYEKPPLDDALAQLVGPDYTTLEDLKQAVRESLLEDEGKRAQGRYLDKVLDALVETSALDYPPAVIEDQLDAMMQDMDQRLRQFGLDGMNALLRQTKQSEDQYRDQMRPDAIKIAERNLVLSEVIKQEAIEATQEDIEQRIKQTVGADENGEISESSAELAEVLRYGAGRNMIVSQVLTDKAIALLQALARGEEPPSFTTESGAETLASTETEGAESPTAEVDDATEVTDDSEVVAGDSEVAEDAQ
ncbi:trigger factor [Caldilinea sp.]|uniref:trigger factor n=1 Tax=Caldilinea sp. TaxID=2293560 RepID=UPI002C1FA0C0|nr:trigger factor [Caldilinea sp.]HRA64454.1 trigger factor [Caldilinea sp.]